MSTITRPDPTATQMLEEPTIRIPYELMRRNHRAAQRQVEKDFTFLQATLKSAKEASNPETSAFKLKEGLTRIGNLKRKFQQIQPSSDQPNPLNIRLQTLSSISSSSSSSPPTSNPNPTEPTPTEPTPSDPTSLESTWQDWSAQRLDRFIVEYLSRNGRLKSAEVYARKQGIEDLVDVGLYQECSKIENALLVGHGCSEALAWCGENRGTLKKQKNTLEFSLRLQEYIELCRLGKSDQALTYVRKYLALWATSPISMTGGDGKEIVGDANANKMEELKKVMPLMAFGEKNGVERYKAYYDSKRWTDLRNEFKQTFNSVYGIPSHSILQLTLSAGLTALKLSACQNGVTGMEKEKSGDDSEAMDITESGGPRVNPSPMVPSTEPPTPNPPVPTSNPTPTLLDTRFAPPSSTHSSFNMDCPSCQPKFQSLVQQVPFSHHTNSKLVCRISGEMMDSDNMPMCFPNGCVYSNKALLEMSKSMEGKVRCPRTGDTCLYTELKKVYIS